MWGVGVTVVDGGRACQRGCVSGQALPVRRAARRGARLFALLDTHAGTAQMSLLCQLWRSTACGMVRRFACGAARAARRKERGAVWHRVIHDA